MSTPRPLETTLAVFPLLDRLAGHIHNMGLKDLLSECLVWALNQEIEDHEAKIRRARTVLGVASLLGLTLVAGAASNRLKTLGERRGV